MHVLLAKGLLLNMSALLPTLNSGVRCAGGCVNCAGRIHWPSPAVAFVGRHNSGKTTLIVKVIAELTARGVNIGTVKHHGHVDFDIDIPGKDSYRHREAGSRDVVVVSPVRMARITELKREVECSDIVESMPDHDLVIVEGFRQSGLDVIEVMRDANERDAAAADEFCASGTVRGGRPIAVASDIARVHEAAAKLGVRAFGLDDVTGIVDFLQANYVRPRLTVAIQAGGESRRMGQSKASVPFLGEPLLTRIVQRVACVADELVITTNEASRLGFLGDVDLRCPVRLVPDDFDTRGSLRGLHTAFQAASMPLCAVVACDMVFASPKLIVAEATCAHAEHVDAVVPCNRNGYEPFHAVYRTKTCLAATEEALAQGRTRARDFFDLVRLRPFLNAEVARAVPERGCFVNVNTPEELARVEATILAEGDC